MKIVTWNVNGIRARKEYVELFLLAHNPDILCIQELKSSAEQVPVELFTNLGYKVALHGQPRWNGVLIASKWDIDSVVTKVSRVEGEQSRLIYVQSNGLHLVNLYCPQGSSADSDKFVYKKEFYDGLIDWVSDTFQVDQDLILTGDFNIAPYAHDLYDVSKFVNVPTFHPEELIRWQKLLDWGLSDLSEGLWNPGTFTFWDYRFGAFQRNMGMRIDHFIGTASIQKRVESMQVIRDFRKVKKGLKASDHAPVELVLKPVS